MRKPGDSAIEFIKYWAPYKPGHVMLEPMSKGWADLLVRRGIAKWYKPVEVKPKRKRKNESQDQRRTRPGTG